MSRFKPAETMRTTTDAVNSYEGLVQRILDQIYAASASGQYTVTVDVESRVENKQRVMDELKAAGYAVSGTRGVKTFRIAWK